MQNAIDLIKESNEILLTGHLRADGDCLGAQIVLYYALSKLGKKVQIMLPNLPDQRYGFLEQQTPWSIYDDELPSYDLLIACDCNELPRLGGMVPQICSWPRSTRGRTTPASTARRWTSASPHSPASTTAPVPRPAQQASVSTDVCADVASPAPIVKLAGGPGALLFGGVWGEEPPAKKKKLYLGWPNSAR